MGGGHQARPRWRRPSLPTDRPHRRHGKARCLPASNHHHWRRKSGSDVRRTLGGTPFGWPRDAVDAALIALHRLQHLTATLNGQAVPLGQLDQNKIAKADFRVEHATLTVGDRLILRKLFQAMGLSCKSGEEAVRAGEFLSGFIVLAKSAGGDVPLPPSPANNRDRGHSAAGRQRAASGHQDQGACVEDEIKAWTTTRDLIGQRLPTWNLVGRLAKHAAAMSEQPHLEQIEAIRSHLFQQVSPYVHLFRAARPPSRRCS